MRKKRSPDKLLTTAERERRTIRFFVACNPVAQGRGRIVKRGKFYGIKDPEKSAEYKRTLAILAQEHRPQRPIEGPVYIFLGFRYARPASRKKTEFWKVTTPDIDNLEKAILDALNGIMWIDDKQVVAVSKFKFYAETPGVDVWIRELSHEETLWADIYKL